VAVKGCDGCDSVSVSGECTGAVVHGAGMTSRSVDNLGNNLSNLQNVMFTKGKNGEKGEANGSQPPSLTTKSTGKLIKFKGDEAIIHYEKHSKEIMDSMGKN